jgi:hypothetical protein
VIESMIARHHMLGFPSLDAVHVSPGNHRIPDDSGAAPRCERCANAISATREMKVIPCTRYDLPALLSVGTLSSSSESRVVPADRATLNRAPRWAEMKARSS